MTNIIVKFTELEKKMVPLLPGNHDLLNLKFRKMTVWLKTEFFLTDSCLLTLTTSTSHM